MNPPSLDRLKSERTPPHSTEAEQGVLGCILWDAKESLPLCVEKFAGVESPFYDLRHESIFKACTALADKAAPVEIISLQQQLKDSKELDRVGGPAYLSSLQDTVPSAANLSYYLDIVAEKALLRASIATCQRFIAEAYEAKEEPQAMIDGLERDVLAIRHVSGLAQKSTKELVRAATDRLEKLFQSQGAITGIPTGLVDCDQATDGMQRGDLFLLAGYPSTGKTSLAMNIAEHVALKEKLPVLIFSLEMTGELLMTRAQCSVARVSMRQIQMGMATADDFKNLTRAQCDLAKSPLHIRTESDLSVDTMRAIARRMKQQHGIELIIVDYMQKLNAKGKRSDMNQAEELGLISSACKACAMELNVPFILLSQLTDEGKIYGSRVPGHDADVMVKIKNDGEWVPDNQPIQLIIEKQRNGDAGITVPLIFRKSITRFECVAKITPEDMP